MEPENTQCIVVKRGRGRPRKYHTEEERKEARKIQERAAKKKYIKKQNPKPRGRHKKYATVEEAKAAKKIQDQIAAKKWVAKNRDKLRIKLRECAKKHYEKNKAEHLELLELRKRISEMESAKKNI
jgi:hypothetical protein